MTTYNTGNPIGSTDARDRLDNSENMDILENSTTLNEHADRLGTMRKTRKGMELEHDNQISAHETEHNAQMQSFENDFDSRLAGMAFTRVGTFTAGATLTDMRQTLLWEVSQGGDGHEYGWTGSFLPTGKIVSAGSSPTPVSAGNWVDRTEDLLRSDLNVVVKVFESVADMVADASLVVGQKCRTLGYYAAGDGGGNHYEIVAAATGNDDGGSYINLVGISGQAKGLFVNCSVNVKQFGAKGDDATNSVTAMQAALNYAPDSVLVPSNGTYLISSDVTIPAGVSLTVDGTISGSGQLTALGSSVISGIGSISCGNVWQLKVTAGDVVVRGLSFGKGSTYGVYVLPSAEGIDSLSITNNRFDGNRYGILKNNNSNYTVFDVRITDNILQNSTGDGIEWNVGITDERIVIDNNTVYNTVGSITNSGIGIGVAGAAYTHTGDAASQTKYISISSNFIRGAGQGIHCENVRNAKITDNHISDCTSSYAGPGLTEAGGITTYQLIESMVSNNYIEDCENAIHIYVGAISSVFTGSANNTSVINNTAINSGNIKTQSAYYTPSGNQVDNNPTLVVKDNVLILTGMTHIGGCNLYIEGNTITTRAGTTGLNIDFRSSVFGYSYQPLVYNIAVIKNNAVYDKLGRVNAVFSGFNSANGHDGNIKVFQCGNSFNITVSDSWRQPVPSITRTTSTAVDGFPYGMEFQVGDMVVNNITPAVHLVTSAGSRNRTSDLYVIVTGASGVIRTGNYPWPDADHHELGQAVTLSDGVITPVQGYIGRIYIESSQYMMDIVDSTGAPLDLGSLGNGTITATNPVAYTRLV